MTDAWIDDLVTRVLRAAYLAATLWVLSSIWGTWLACGVVAWLRLNSPLADLFGYRFAWWAVKDVYVNLLGLLVPLGVAPLCAPAKRPKWPIWLCMVLGAVTWYAFAWSAIRE